MRDSAVPRGPRLSPGNSLLRFAKRHFAPISHRFRTDFASISVSCSGSALTCQTCHLSPHKNNILAGGGGFKGDELARVRARGSSRAGGGRKDAMPARPSGAGAGFFDNSKSQRSNAGISTECRKAPRRPISCRRRRSARPDASVRGRGAARFCGHGCYSADR